MLQDPQLEQIFCLDRKLKSLNYSLFAPAMSLCGRYYEVHYSQAQRHVRL